MADSFILFPVMIDKKTSFLSPEECDSMVAMAKKTNLLKHEHLVGNAKSCHENDSDFLKKADKDIIKKLLTAIEEYGTKFGLHPLDISNSWVNTQKEGSQLNMHCHPDSIVSGTIYLKCNKNSNQLYFYNPNPHISFMNIKTYNVFNYSYVGIKPQIGDLILFPSWLMHGSHKEKNKCKERIALSFNTRYYETPYN